MKKAAIYILVVLTFLTAFAGCKGNEAKASPTPAVTHTPAITATPMPETAKPHVTTAPTVTDEVKPDVKNGIVDDKDGIITEKDNARGAA